jgi:hypothetical protein
MSECRVIREVFYLRVGTESEAQKGYYKVKLFRENRLGFYCINLTGISLLNAWKENPP